MAVTNFIPQIWEARLLAKFHERSITDLITTAPTKVEGNKIIFNHVSDVSINAYEGTVNFEDLTTSKVELPLDHKNYWAFKVDDVDAVQAAGDLIYCLSFPLSIFIIIFTAAIKALSGTVNRSLFWLILKNILILAMQKMK